MSTPKSLREISCADDYDPNSMPVDRARELIRTFLVPVTATERVHLRAAIARVLAVDVTSPHDVPGHDSSAMDGYAVRFADLCRSAKRRSSGSARRSPASRAASEWAQGSACASLPAP
jgi:molybdopterin molybdotransferase